MARSAICRIAAVLAAVSVVVFNIPAPSAQEIPRIASVTLSSNRVPAGAPPITGTVTLDRAAVSNSTINLHAVNAPAGTVPASVIIAKGKTQATFTVKIGNPSVTVTIGITAMYNGSMQGANLVVEVPLVPKVRTISLNPNVVGPGGKTLVVVQLNTIAPVGGLLVALSYNPALLASGPASATVPERASATEFWVTVGSPANQSTADVKATTNQDSVSATITIKGSAPITPVQATVFPGRLKSEGTAMMRVTLSGPAPSGGLTVTFTSNSPGELSVEPSVNVPAGATSVSANVRVANVQKSGTAYITATASGVPIRAAVEIAR